jgi:signal transduction histidine kinase
LTGLISREMADLGFPLEVRLASALPPVQCDTVQIEQVLINLIRNAADAMLAAQVEGEIRLIVEPTARRTVRLAVVDQGGGLAGVDGNRIFDAFYTTKPEGLGMGLPICKTIVEAHGGSLVAEANPEGGLTMAFELPVASGALFGVLEKSDAE